MKITEKAIMQKINRQRNPVTNLVQLAHEFGVNTSFTRSNGRLGNAAPGSFRAKVLREVGPRTYKLIRDNSHVRVA